MLFAVGAILIASFGTRRRAMCGPEFLPRRSAQKERRETGNSFSCLFQRAAAAIRRLQTAPAARQSCESPRPEKFATAAVSIGIRLSRRARFARFVHVSTQGA